MNGGVVCPSCGKVNDSKLATTYRMCAHCGADLTSALGATPSVPVQEAQMGGPAPPVQQPYGAPPPYGQQPPPYGQPYPPPPGAMPPPPGYPGVPYAPPSNHPGVYDRPEEPGRFDIGNLFRLLWNPKEAFEDLYNHSTPAQGVFLAVLFIVISSLLGYTVISAALEDIEIPEDPETGIGFDPGTYSLQATIGGIVLSVVMFFIITWFIFVFVKSKANRPDLGKTLALEGYATFPFFLIGLIVLPIIASVFSAIPWEEISQPDYEPETMPTWISEVCGLVAGMFILLIIGFFWALWVHGHSVSVANDTSTGSAMGWVFLAWFVGGIIRLVIGTLTGVGGMF